MKKLHKQIEGDKKWLRETINDSTKHMNENQLRRILEHIVDVEDNPEE